MKQSQRTLILLLAAFAAITFHPVVKVHAADASGPARVRMEDRKEFREKQKEEFKAKVQDKKDDAVKKLSEKAAREIQNRIAAMNKLIERINAMVRLTSEQKSSLVSQVQAEISALTSLQEKINANTDIATLRTDVQSIVKSYRIYALFIPKVYVISHADRIISVADSMVPYTDKLQSRITEAKSAGKDTTEAQTLLTDRQTKVAQAKADAQKAIDTVIPLTADGYPGNMSTLKDARNLLSSARKALDDAHKGAQKIREILNGFGMPMPTATPKSE